MSLKTEAPADSELLLNDLGPLAWVLEELRKSLDFSNKALRRFVREADLARGTELTEMDASQLRVARQHLHQAVGALEMIGLPTPASLLRSMEAVVQKYVQHPELCNEAAAVAMDRNGIALTEFLEGVLKGKSASPVALFPQYRAVQELAGAERIHPADLWPVSWRWEPVALAGKVAPLPYAPEVRGHLDRTVLNVVKTADKKSALLTGRVALGLAMAQKSLKPATFWAIAAAYFEALGHGSVPVDIYTRRTASPRFAAICGPCQRGSQSIRSTSPGSAFFLLAGRYSREYGGSRIASGAHRLRVRAAQAGQLHPRTVWSFRSIAAGPSAQAHCISG